MANEKLHSSIKLLVYVMQFQPDFLQQVCENYYLFTFFFHAYIDYLCI